MTETKFTIVRLTLDGDKFELLVKPDSQLIGRSASSTRLRSRYGINLLAISRQSHRSIKRLRSTLIQNGDVLLMQGGAEDIG